MSTGNPVLDGWLYAASWLFLVGIVLVVASAVPAFAGRFPRLLVLGFMLALASLAVVLIAALALG